MSDRGFSISIFLPDGSSESPRLIEKSNWTGKAVSCTRGQYTATRTRPEFNGPGIYVLFGPTDDPTRKRVYIGESDNSRERINNHLKDKDFWENVILFTAKDDSLNKAHTRYIEARLIDVARNANRSDVENGNLPPSPPLSEAEAAFADTFCDEMLSIYPVLGLEAFESVAATALTSHYYLTGPETKAEGARAQDQFVVFKDSSARNKTVPSMPSTYGVLREKLVGEGLLVDAGASLKLTEDCFFSSPSAAAAVFLGRSANGLNEWRDGDGATLKELELLAAAAPPSAGEPLADPAF